MVICFYKANQKGIKGLFNRLVKWWTKGPYSHCEIWFSDGISASSSFTDGGVRFKHISYDSSKWDFLYLPSTMEPRARQWFEENNRKPYDVFGIAGFVARAITHSKNKFFCSEAIALALGFNEAWRFDPNTLYILLKHQEEFYGTCTRD